MLDGAFFMIVIALPIIRLKHYFENIYLYQAYDFVQPAAA